MALLTASVSGRAVLAGWDHLFYWYPLMEFFRTRFHADGVIPFWIPNLFAGMPLPESLGPSFFYPTDLLCWAGGVPVHLFYAWDAAVHLAIAAAGVFVLVRILGAAPAAAAVAAVSYAVGGYLEVQLAAGTQVFIRASALVPWVFVAMQTIRNDPAWWRAAGLAVLLALLVLTQSFQVLAYLPLLVAVFWWLAPLPPVRAARAYILVGAAVLVAGALSAVVLVPAWTYYGLSFRSAPSGVWAGMEFLRWPQAVMLVLPDWLGKGGEAKYLGIIPVVLGVAALVTAPRRTAAWGALVALAIVLACGPGLAPGRWLARLPVYRGFRAAAHWVLFAQLGVSVLAGLALAPDADVPGRRRRILAGALCAAAALAAAGWLAAPGALTTAARACAVGAALCAAGGAVVLLGARWSGGAVAAGLALLIVADAALPGRPHPRQVNEAALGTWNGGAAALGLLPHPGSGVVRLYSEEPHEFLNSRIADGLEWTTGYHGAFLGNYGRFYDAAIRCGRVVEAMGVLGAAYAVVGAPPRTGALVPLRSFAGGDGGSWWLCRMERHLGGVFVPRNVVADPDGSAALRALCAGRLSTERTAWVESAAPGLPRRGSEADTARTTRRTPNVIDAEATVRDRAVVVFAEVAYPAWKAFVDGRRTGVLRADVLLRAVVVPPGRHAIRLIYDSLWFKLGLWLTFASWAALLAGALAGRLP